MQTCTDPYKYIRLRLELSLILKKSSVELIHMTRFLLNQTFVSISLRHVRRIIKVDKIERSEYKHKIVTLVSLYAVALILPLEQHPTTSKWQVTAPYGLISRASLPQTRSSNLYHEHYLPLPFGHQPTKNIEILPPCINPSNLRNSFINMSKII